VTAFGTLRCPAKKYVPRGANTTPPPASLMASNAFWNAAVSSLLLSPLAP